MLSKEDWDKYILARWTYLVGEPILTDMEYEALQRRLKEEDPGNEYFKRSWSFDPCPTELLKQYHMEQYIKDLKLGYFAESIESIISESALEARFAQLHEPTRISFKIDGWNTKASYYNHRLVAVNSRGRNGNNLDLTALHSLYPKEVPYDGRVAIMSELSIPNNLWPEYRARTGNSDQRASVRTAIAQGDVEYLKPVAFSIQGDLINVPQIEKYGIVQSLGMETPLYKIVNDYEGLKSMIQYMSALSKGYSYLTDGLVVENSREQVAVRLGAWEESCYKSHVKGYELAQGKEEFNVKIIIEPVVYEGKTYSKIPLTNWTRVYNGNLGPGSPIAFNVRSSAGVVINFEETAELQRKEGYRVEEHV